MKRATELDAVVLGLGESGFASACHLLAAGRRVAVIDTREQPPRAAELRDRHPEIHLHTGGFDDALIARAAEVVISPGLDPRHAGIREAKRRGQPVIGEIELFARSVNAPVMAITGSNGKSTVTRMLAAMARAAGVDAMAGGNLGPPALTLLENRPDAEVFILELSSFQLESTVSLRPQVATVLNLSPDHLDRYDGMTDYAAAKARILQGAGHAVLNADDDWVRGMADDATPVSWFSARGASGAARWRLGTVDGVDWLMYDDQPLLRQRDLSVVGRHNALNALAALAMGEAAGWPLQPMCRALETFQSLPHRGERLGVHRDRLWVNDSKATNAASAAAAVAGMEQPVVLLAGGDAKGQSFEVLAAALADRGRAAVVYGRDADALARSLASSLPVECVDDLEAAVEAAERRSQPGDVVLLSPACASLDQYTDYRARGEHFRALVEALADE
ncbi:UDP-N-acetylmuramoyl-L-alanine--D-glutamate ligase [Spiribacter insolitus]|uniref:UDP-N-acetylmuramoylalanine--D-glutamate ligase n=1 Tax=Spiribacter insolitus TaxID=3122417 RepID=A0ABV3T444_9GAMM